MDIDIDFPSHVNLTEIFPEAILASMIKNEELTKHPCGVYFQHIPVDRETNLSAIPYNIAPDLGFFKIDFLRLHVLDQIKSKEHIRSLTEREPDWSMLQDEQIVARLFQISKHYNILQQLKPTDVNTLADVVAIIRPNKKHLLSQYLANKTKIRPLLYRQDGDDKSSFKRCHAIAYALTIIMQLNYIKETS